MSHILPTQGQINKKQYSSLQNIDQTTPNLLKQDQQQQLQPSNEIQMIMNQEQNSIDNTIQAYDPYQLNVINKKRKLFASNVILTGHQGEIYSAKYSPDGNILASAGFDKQILIWDLYNNCENSYFLRGHTNAILEIQFNTEGNKLYSCSADKTIAIWDLESMKRQKKYSQHTSFVNSIYPARRGPELIVSGSDDGTFKIWDLRTKRYVTEYQNKYQVTSVTFSDTSDKVYFGSLDNTVKSYDMRKKAIENIFKGHEDTISSLALSNNGNFLLSNSMDQSIICWDLRPFVVGKRQLKLFQGANHGSDKNLLKVNWSKNDQMITAGSSDKYVYIWNFDSQKIIHKLAGHKGTVNETIFNPKENQIASCSSDKNIIVGEIPEVTL